MNYRECFITLASHRVTLNVDMLEVQALFNAAHDIMKELSDPLVVADENYATTLLEQHSWLMQKIKSILNKIQH